MFEKIKAYHKLHKQFKEFENEKIMEQVQKEQFLSSNTNIEFLEKMIQKCNSNPDLKVEMVLKDGTILRLKSTPIDKKRDFDYLEVE